MKRKLVTRHVESPAEIRAHFDREAESYREAHGNPDRLLNYRLRLIKDVADLQPQHTVLEVGCGTGIHLLALAEKIGRGIGIDFSQRMIDIARRRAADAGLQERVDFRVDDAATLQTVPDAGIDRALCIGALEHVPDKAAVARSVRRVLKPGGRWVILTPNGGYLWYRRLAPLLGADTRHYSSDRFLNRGQLRKLLDQAGFEQVVIRPWSFIPRGDMPAGWGLLLSFFDRVGKFIRLETLRGGLLVSAKTEL